MVRVCSSVSTEANNTSPQASMNAKIDTATMTGRAGGSRTLTSSRSGPAPSTRAASSSSRGMLSN
jgi:hypothetical protein